MFAGNGARLTERRWLVWPVLVAIAAGLLATRRPDYLFHATFWAEDGWRWYPDAYEHGWRSLLEPWTGYLQTDSRLVALAAQIVPLRWAPTLFAVFALTVQACTAVFMLSDRLRPACPDLRVRALFALLYIFLPNSFETYANLTNTQWHLALLSFLVVSSRPPLTRAGRGVDGAILLFSGLSGPFCFFIAPVAIWRAAASREPTLVARASIVSAAAMLQLWMLFGHGAPRPPGILGIGPRRLATIVSLQVVLGLILGRHSAGSYTALSLWQDGALPVLVALAATVFTARRLWAGPPFVRWACFVGGSLFGAALASPAIGGENGRTAWALLSIPDVGNRYYLLPMLAWAVVLIASCADRLRLIRWSARALVALTILNLPGDWGLPTSIAIAGRTDFVARATAFETAGRGDIMEFPLHPVGVPPMSLHHR